MHYLNDKSSPVTNPDGSAINYADDVTREAFEAGLANPGGTQLRDEPIYRRLEAQRRGIELEEAQAEQISQMERESNLVAMMSEEKHYRRLADDVYKRRKALLAPREPLAANDWLDGIVTEAIEKSLLKDRREGDL
jgi:hypothetical protein